MTTIEKWEVAKAIGIYWIVGFSLLVVVIYVRDKSKLINWRKLFSEHINDIVSKVFSFDEALEPKFIVDPKGNIKLINKAAVELFGYTKEELKGMTIDIVIPEDRRAAFHKMFETTLTYRQFKMEAVCKKGTCPVEVFLRKKQVDDHAFFLVILKDRTEAVRMARNLQQVIEIQNIKLEVLIKGEEVGKGGSWIWDAKKETILTSPGYRHILGLEPTKAEFDRQYIRDKVYEKDEHIVNAALDKAFRGEPYNITYRIMRSRDFKLVTIQSFAQPIMNENRVLTHIYGNMRMISEIDILEAKAKE